MPRLPSRVRALAVVGAGAIFATASAAVVASCAAPPAAAPAPAPAAPPVALHRGPLPSYLPSPGLRWALALRPRALLENPLIQSETARLVPPARLDAFTAASGVDPRALEEAWLAEYELGSLVLAADAPATRDAAARFEARALSLSKRKTPTPALTHLVGLVQDTPSAFVRLEGSLVAWASGDLSLAKMIRGYAEKKITRVPPALEGLLLAPLSSLVPDAPVRLFGLGPFSSEEPLATGAVSVSLALTFEGEELLAQASLLGAWESQPSKVASELRESLDALLESPELRALGSASRSRPLAITCGPLATSDHRLAGLTHCEATTAFSAREVLQRVAVVLVGSLEEITAESPPR